MNKANNSSEIENFKNKLASAIVDESDNKIPEIVARKLADAAAGSKELLIRYSNQESCSLLAKEIINVNEIAFVSKVDVEESYNRISKQYSKSLGFLAND